MELGSPVRGKRVVVNQDYDAKDEYIIITGKYTVERLWIYGRLDESDIIHNVVKKIEDESNGEASVRYIRVDYINSEDLGWGRFRDIYDVEVHIYARGFPVAAAVAIMAMITIIVGLITYTIVFAPDKFEKVVKAVGEAASKAAGGLAGVGKTIILIIILLIIFNILRR